MSDKYPTLKMSIPSHVSYEMGMLFRNIIVGTMSESDSDPRICEYLKIKPVDTHNQTTQDITVINIMDLISNDKLYESDSESDNEDDG